MHFPKFEIKFATPKSVWNRFFFVHHWTKRVWNHGKPPDLLSISKVGVFWTTLMEIYLNDSCKRGQMHGDFRKEDPRVAVHPLWNMHLHWNSRTGSDRVMNLVILTIYFLVHIYLRAWHLLDDSYIFDNFENIAKYNGNKFCITKF